MIALSALRAASRTSFLNQRSIATDAPKHAVVDSLPCTEILNALVRTCAGATLLSAMLTNAAALPATTELICGAPAARSNRIPRSSRGIDPLMGSSPLGSRIGFPFRPTGLKSDWGRATATATLCAQLPCCCHCCCTRGDACFCWCCCC